MPIDALGHDFVDGVCTRCGKVSDHPIRNWDEADTAQNGIAVIIGNAYGAPGGTAHVDIFVHADELDPSLLGLRNWQFTFDGLELSGTEDLKPYVSGKLPSGTENLLNNEAMCSSDTGENCGTVAQILAEGGWKIATIGFTVPADAQPGDTYELNITDITSLAFETPAYTYVFMADSAYVVSGTVRVVAGTEGVADAVEGAGEDYAIPSVNAANELVSDIGSGITGSFGTLTIPASVTETFKLGRKTTKFDGITALDSLILLNADMNESELDYIFALAENVDEINGINVYYVQKATKDGLTAACLEALESEDKDFLNPQNVLKVTNVAAAGSMLNVTGSVADGKTTLPGCFFEIKFAEADKTFVINSSGLGASVAGIPSGTHTVSVTLYTYVESAGGAQICVCSDTVTQTVVIA
jgi:hypothetical protein